MRRGETIQLDQPEGEPIAEPGAAQFQIASSNGSKVFSSVGSKVFFTSTQQLTDGASEDSSPSDSAMEGHCASTTGPNGCNLYQYDLANPSGHNLTAVSAGDASGLGPRVQGVVAVSADGSHVYFVAAGTLTPQANSLGQSALSGAENLYVFERDAHYPSGRVAFISSLSTLDSREWVNPGVGQANVTPDGRFLVFTSHADLTPDDTSTNAAAQVFRYDAQTGALERISIGNDAFNDNGNAGPAEVCTAPRCGPDATIVPAANTLTLSPGRTDPTMSDDGTFIYFESPARLTPQALDYVRVGTNAQTGKPVYAQNVYEYRQGHVYLISDGRDTSTFGGGSFKVTASAVELLGADTNGANVFFTSHDQLAAQETGSQFNIYDARVCTSGDPCVAPPTAAVPCREDACQPPSGPPPSPPAVATITFAGPENPPAPPKLPSVSVLGKLLRGSTVTLEVAVPGGGALSVGGPGVRTIRRPIARAGTYRLRLELSSRQKRALRSNRRFELKLTVRYLPATGPPASVTVTLSRHSGAGSAVRISTGRPTLDRLGAR